MTSFTSFSSFKMAFFGLFSFIFVFFADLEAAKPFLPLCILIISKIELTFSYFHQPLSKIPFVQICSFQSPMETGHVSQNQILAFVEFWKRSGSRSRICCPTWSLSCRTSGSSSSSGTRERSSTPFGTHRTIGIKESWLVLPIKIYFFHRNVQECSSLK